MTTKTIFVKGTTAHTVSITVYAEDGSVEVDTLMTEITTTGIYKYSLTATTGYYYAVITDDTTGRSMGGQTIDLGGINPTTAEIADAVWDEDLSGHTVSGSAGKVVKSIKDFVLVILASIL